MKILYVTTVSMTMGFFYEHFKMLTEEGHTVELACNCDDPIPDFCVDMGLKVHNIPFSRSPLSPSNIKALKNLKKLVKFGGYDIVHTHTPNASACVRLACRKMRKKGLKVFYTAHGFHFYKGAPLKNWMIYYPVEWLCAHWTDKLITINREDHEFALKHMKAKKVEYVPGVGIDLKRFDKTIDDRSVKRRELGVPEDAKLLLSVGELNDNKNHEMVIKAIDCLDVYYIIVGAGDKEEYLRSVIESKGLDDRIKLLGYRTDVRELYSASDIFVFPSYREGLSVSLMEAMASSLPIACSAIRGNVDLVDENGGELFDPHSAESVRNAISRLITRDLCLLGQYNREKSKKFSNEEVLSQMRKIYEE